MKCSGQLQVGFQVALPLQQVNVPGGFDNTFDYKRVLRVYEQLIEVFCLYSFSFFCPFMLTALFSPPSISHSSLATFLLLPVSFPLPQFFPHPLHLPHRSSPLLASCFIYGFCPPPPKLFALPRLPHVVKARSQRLDAALFLFVIILFVPFS